jgi:hypothetical protein
MKDAIGNGTSEILMPNGDHILSLISNPCKHNAILATLELAPVISEICLSSKYATYRRCCSNSRVANRKSTTAADTALADVVS